MLIKLASLIFSFSILSPSSSRAEDFGCQAPVLANVEALKQRGFEVINMFDTDVLTNSHGGRHYYSTMAGYRLANSAGDVFYSSCRGVAKSLYRRATFIINAHLTMTVEPQMGRFGEKRLRIEIPEIEQIWLITEGSEIANYTNFYGIDYPEKAREAFRNLAVSMPNFNSMGFKFSAAGELKNLYFWREGNRSYVPIAFRRSE